MPDPVSPWTATVGSDIGNSAMEWCVYPGQNLWPEINCIFN